MKSSNSSPKVNQSGSFTMQPKSFQTRKCREACDSEALVLFENREKLDNWLAGRKKNAFPNRRLQFNAIGRGRCAVR